MFKVYGACSMLLTTANNDEQFKFNGSPQRINLQSVVAHSNVKSNFQFSIGFQGGTVQRSVSKELFVPWQSEFSNSFEASLITCRGATRGGGSLKLVLI
jgi:hypothetical protein